MQVKGLDCASFDAYKVASSIPSYVRNSLCLPKDQGDMGFRLMKDINISLITKLGWNILSNYDSL